MKRHPRLVWFIFTPFLALSLVVLGLLYWQGGVQLQSFFLAEITKELETQAQMLSCQVSQTLSADTTQRRQPDVDALCKKLGALFATRITVILPAGWVIGDSDEMPESMENHAKRPEIVQAFSGGMGESQRMSTTMKQDMLYVAVPMFADKTVVAVVRTSKSLHGINERIEALFLKIGLSALAVCLVALAASLLISIRISQPIRKVQALAQNYARGEFQAEVPDPRPRELAELTESISAMGQTIQSRLNAISKQKHILGQEVRQRTRVQEELQKANAKLEVLAALDGLTGLANRRKFDEALLLQWDCMARERKPLTLIMGDADHFKRYNDTYGHQHGDDCLKAISACLAWCCRRPADLPARYGGEEFALLLPDTDESGATQVAENIQTTLAERGIEHASSPVSPFVTLSLGIAVLYPAPGTDPTALVELADKALYAAKSQGRNRFVLRTSLDET